MQLSINSHHNKANTPNFGRLKKLTYNYNFVRDVNREIASNAIHSIKKGYSPLGKACEKFDEVQLHFDLNHSFVLSLGVRYRNKAHNFYNRIMRFLGKDWNEKTIEKRFWNANQLVQDTVRKTTFENFEYISPSEKFMNKIHAKKEII